MPTSNRLSRTHSPLPVRVTRCASSGGPLPTADEQPPADLQGVLEAGVVDRQRAGQRDDVVSLALGEGHGVASLRP